MMFSWLVGAMARSLFVTVAAEAVAAWLWGLRDRDGQSLVLLANLATNPPLVAALHIATIYLGHGPARLLLVCMEAAAWLAEGWIYQKKLPACRHPFRFSALANACSFGTGRLLNLLHLLFL